MGMVDVDVHYQAMYSNCFEIVSTMAFLVSQTEICLILYHYTINIYVTEYWKTDHVRTFGQLLFIGPANSHTHTLPVHCCINGLS